MTLPTDRNSESLASECDEAAEVLLRFGTAMLRAGNPAVRTREWLEVLAQKMGFEALAVSLSLDSVTIRARRSAVWVMAMREIGPPGINAWRIGELEQIGCEFKGEEGLVDFHGTLEGREIFWCWKLGEDRITHWHELDAGFKGRQPIPEVVSRA